MDVKLVQRVGSGYKSGSGYRFPHGFYVRESHNESFDLENLNTIEAWCLDQFGEGGWFRFGYGFWFKADTDATAFKLRWL